MIVFRRHPSRPWDPDPEDERLIDWQLLRHSPVVLYHSRQVLEEHIEALESCAWRCITFECAAWESELDMHRAFTSCLNYPPPPSLTLGALQDCLEALLPAPEFGGAALVLWDFDKFFQKAPGAWHVLDILVRLAWERMLYGDPVLGLVQTNDPQLSLPPVGAWPVRWNPKECRDKDRA